MRQIWQRRHDLRRVARRVWRRDRLHGRYEGPSCRVGTRRKEGREGRRGAVCVSTSYVCITKRDSIRLDQQPSPAPASPSTYPRNYVIFSKRLQLPPPSIRFLPCKYKYIPQAAPGNTYLSSRLVSSRLVYAQQGSPRLRHAVTPRLALPNASPAQVRRLGSNVAALGMCARAYESDGTDGL